LFRYSIIFGGVSKDSSTSRLKLVNALTRSKALADEDKDEEKSLDYSDNF